LIFSFSKFLVDNKLIRIIGSESYSLSSILSSNVSKDIFYFDMAAFDYRHELL